MAFYCGLSDNYAMMNISLFLMQVYYGLLDYLCGHLHAGQRGINGALG